MALIKNIINQSYQQMLARQETFTKNADLDKAYKEGNNEWNVLCI